MQDLILAALAADKKINLQRFDDEATGLQAMISAKIDLVGTGLLSSTARAEPQRPGKNYEGQVVLRELRRHRRAARLDRPAAVAQHLRLRHREQRRAQATISRKWRERRAALRHAADVSQALPDHEAPAPAQIMSEPEARGPEKSGEGYVCQFGSVWPELDKLLQGTWLTLLPVALTKDCSPRGPASPGALGQVSSSRAS